MFEINPNALYPIRDIEDSLGRRCLERLRGAGLTALSGFYLGENILDSLRRAVAEKSRQRVPVRKGERTDERTGHKEVTMETGVISEGSVQPIPKRMRPDDLGSQLQEFNRRTSRKVFAKTVPSNVS